MKRSNVHADIISILEYINNIDDGEDMRGEGRRPASWNLAMKRLIMIMRACFCRENTEGMGYKYRIHGRVEMSLT